MLFNLPNFTKGCWRATLSNELQDLGARFATSNSKPAPSATYIEANSQVRGGCRSVTEGKMFGYGGRWRVTDGKMFAYGGRWRVADGKMFASGGRSRVTEGKTFGSGGC